MKQRNSRLFLILYISSILAPLGLTTGCSKEQAATTPPPAAVPASKPETTTKPGDVPVPKPTEGAMSKEGAENPQVQQDFKEGKG